MFQLTKRVQTYKMRHKKMELSHVIIIVNLCVLHTHSTFINTIPFYISNIFFYKDLVTTTRVPDLPFAGGSNRPKNLKNSKKKTKKKKYLLIHPFTHTFVHTLLSAPEAVTPDRQSAT